jgi:hypothetical protein
LIVLDRDGPVDQGGQRSSTRPFCKGFLALKKHQHGSGYVLFGNQHDFIYILVHYLKGQTARLLDRDAVCQ